MKENKNSPIYVGQTKRTAHTRLLEEIKTANDQKSNTPISQFIKRIGRYNVSVYVLQKVNDESMLDHYERMWIHKLETHINKKGKLALNINWEHQPLLKKNRNNKLKIKKKEQNHENVILKQLNTIYHMAKYRKIADQTPKMVNSINLANLYKILSILTGKIIKHKNYVASKEEENLCVTTHNTLANKIGLELIHIISIYITEEICNAIERLTVEGHKSKKTFKPIQICTIINLGRYNKICQLTKIMNRSLYLIADAMPYMEKPKIVYKNLSNNGVKFMNHKKAALELIDKSTYKNMYCKCLHNKNEVVKRDGHINTGSMDVVKFILHKEIYVAETIEELKLGVKFIPKPNIDKKEIAKTYTMAIEQYKNKINKIKTLV